MDRLPADMAALKRFGLQLLALRIETLAEFECFRDLGFDYFQGYFLSRPRVIKHGASLPPNKIALLRLFAIIHDPLTETREIERAIAADPILSYKLLRLINSAFFNLPRPVTALKDTILLLGRQRLATWCTLLALTQLSDKPAAVFVIALARARMCELLGEATNSIESGDGFIVGLLSALDILLDRPLPQVISPLPLSSEIKQAILGHEGVLGRYLGVVMAYELSRWREIARGGIPAALLTRARLDALDWASSVLQLTANVAPPRIA
ncbi:EAL and HDOD domain-containing protein [Acidihalobacter yilgarnensis]|nr:HDOD domain-containing protein [Acidihalobacter yilgarnensis]